MTVLAAPNRAAIHPIDRGRVPEPAARSLTTRFFDFWLLGGASVFVWLTMFVLQHFRSSWAIDHWFKDLSVTAVSLTLIVNNPHFLVSYKLAYSRGRSFIAANSWQLAVVPALLVALFAVAYAKFDAPTATMVPLAGNLAGIIGSWGLGTAALSTPRFGDFLFTLAFNAMFFTVGWHYTKQTFGCMMVYANFDGYRLTPRQRTLIKWNLLSVWWLNFTWGNLRQTQLTFSDFKYYSFDLPDALLPITACSVAAGLALVVYQVFYRNYTRSRQLPSANVLVPFVAMYVWWMPFTRQQEFYLLLTPLFHSLQYLAFVYKLEDSRLKTTSSHYELRATALTIGIVVAGWLSFEYIPATMDAWLGTFNAWRMFFFFTAAMLFINIHHYFIDNVLWRFKDPVVRKYLLA
jgi:hypothetical protein